MGQVRARKLSEMRVPKKQANPIDIQVGNRVRIRRMLIGMSQERLGDLLGLTFQQVQKYEKGVNRIGAGRLFEVARILNVPIDFFYEGLGGAAGQPGMGDSESAPVMEFVSSGEGLQLSLAFMKIKDAKVRKRVLDLVKSLAEEEEQKKRAAERINKLRNLSFNMNSAEANGEYDNVPAYVRRNMELFGNTLTSVEQFYSKYTVKKDENDETQISTINTFLDGKKPD